MAKRNGDTLQLIDNVLITPKGDGYAILKTRDGTKDSRVLLEIPLTASDVEAIVEYFKSGVSSERIAVHLGFGKYDVYENDVRLNEKPIRKKDFAEWGVK